MWKFERNLNLGKLETRHGLFFTKLCRFNTKARHYRQMALAGSVFLALGSIHELSMREDFLRG